jgi:hypothetical protein
MISIALLVVAIITPFVLIFANLVLLAKYIDPQHAAGHYVAKFFLVRPLCGHQVISVVGDNLKSGFGHIARPPSRLPH